MPTFRNNSKIYIMRCELCAHRVLLKSPEGSEHPPTPDGDWIPHSPCNTFQNILASVLTSASSIDLEANFSVTSLFILVHSLNHFKPLRHPDAMLLEAGWTNCTQNRQKIPDQWKLSQRRYPALRHFSIEQFISSKSNF